MKDKKIFKLFLSMILVICFILLIFGFSFTVFEVIIRIRGLDINKYQSIIDLGNICMRYAVGLSVCVIAPGIVVMKNETSKNKLNSFLKTIFSITAIIYIINFIFDIGFFISDFYS